MLEIRQLLPHFQTKFQGCFKNTEGLFCMDLIVATRAEGGLVINPSTLTVNLRSKTYVGNIFQKVSIFLCYPLPRDNQNRYCPENILFSIF